LFTSDVPQPSIVLQPSTTTPPSVLRTPPLSEEDKMILYAALQDIANELRKIHREHKKYQAQREQH